MPKPVLLTVDDDPDVLRAVVRDLRSKYGEDFRVVRADSGASALEAVRELKLRDEQAALFLVDQRMPRMTGIEFLEQAVELFPKAKRVLLTAYADTDAAIRAINKTGIDYYLLKAWDPPEQNLYPVLDDLLDDWTAGYRPGYDGPRIVGHRWSPETHDVKDFLARNQVPYRWLDLEANPDAAELLEKLDTGNGQAPLPVVLFSDGSYLAQPSPAALAERIGLQTQAEKPFYDLVIVGAGPVGLAAAVYGASEGLRTLTVEREAPGGQAGTSSRIENYLGFPSGLSGSDLARRAVTQARRFGAELLTPQEASSLRVEGPYRDSPRIYTRPAPHLRPWRRVEPGVDEPVRQRSGRGRGGARTRCHGARRSVRGHHRQRPRHPGRSALAHLRSLFHDQGCRAGYRAGPRYCPPHHRAARRPH